MQLINRAKEFAKKAHAGQYRKYTGEPYINHPISVYYIVKSVTDDESMLCSALLHDVVEDTDITLAEIEKEFGTEIMTIVSDLTDVSKPTDGNRKIRKAIDREHTSNACIKAKTIKLADLIDNTESIVKYDSKFAKVYMNEKKLLLSVLTEGNKSLYKQAKDIVYKYYLEN